MWYTYLPTEAESKVMKIRFCQASGFPVIIGCINRTNVWIQVPSEIDYLYVNHKGYHSINVQIACHANYNILNLVTRWPGFTHDIRILWESVLYQDFEVGRVKELLLSGYPLKR